MEDVVRFYTAYFSMFRDGRADIEMKIHNALKPFTVNDLVEYEEEMNTCLVWWRKP